MVCPYCNNNSLPNSPICTHCGVIVKLARSIRKPHKKSFAGRRRLNDFLIAAAAAAVLAVAGYFGGRRIHSDVANLPFVLMAAGIALGIGSALGWSALSAAVKSARYQARRHRIQGQIHKIETDREKRLDEMQKTDDDAVKKELDPATRLENATVCLVDGQIDESLQQLEQAYKGGIGARTDFLNNCGVAFARRGQMQLSLDRFQQAIQVGPGTVEPMVNLVYSVLQTGDKKAMTKVLSEQDGVLSRAADQPGVANRIGLSYLLTGQIGDGQRLIESAVRTGDRFQQADAHNDLGIAKAQARKYRDAVSEFAQALHADPGHAPAIANIGVVYYHQRRYADAAGQFETAIGVDPHGGLAHSHLGAALCRLGMTNEGIREFREGRLHEQHLFEPNYNLGKVYTENGVLDEAERCLARANEINPWSWRALVAQAVLLFKLNDIDRATTVYRQAFEVHPEETMVLNGLGLCSTLQGDYDNAHEYFRRALEISASDVNLLTNMAWHFLLRSDVNSATHVLEKAIQIDKRVAQTNDNMGLCQMEMGAHDAAMQYFQQALQSNPELHTVHYNMGNNFIAQKAMDNAIQAWERAKKVETGNADLHTNLGVAYYRKEQFDKSSMEFRRVLHLRQERAEDYANLGLALARMKRHKEAIEQFELGLQVDSRNVMIHSNLGLACFFANRVEDAMRQWQLVTQINKQYAQMRAKKQQSEYDDSSIDYVPLYIAERAVFTDPTMPDFDVAFVPGYQTSRWDLIIGDDEIRRLALLRDEQHRTDRLIRAARF